MANPHPKTRGPSGALGRVHMTRAHQVQRRQAAERRIRHWLDTWPGLADDDREHLADMLRGIPPQP